MSDEYPNLFEKQCDESDRCNDAKEAIDAIRTLREHYTDSFLPVEQNRDERLAEAQELVFSVLSDERQSIATRLAAKYTRNPEYKHHDVDDPGVIDDFEEWQPDNRR
jgi:hypothetical protein